MFLHLFHRLHSKAEKGADKAETASMHVDQKCSFESKALSKGPTQKFSMHQTQETFVGLKEFSYEAKVSCFSAFEHEGLRRNITRDTAVCPAQRR